MLENHYMICFVFDTAKLQPPLRSRNTHKSVKTPAPIPIPRDYHLSKTKKMAESKNRIRPSFYDLQSHSEEPSGVNASFAINMQRQHIVDINATYISTSNNCYFRKTFYDCPSSDIKGSLYFMSNSFVINVYHLITNS